MLSTTVLFLLAGLAAAAPFAAPVQVTAGGPVLRSEFVFPLENPPTPSCHAATIAAWPDGSLAAAWFGGTAEGRPDVGIWFSRRSEESWSRPLLIADGRDEAGSASPCWNPVLAVGAGGRLLLFYKVGPGPAAWRGFMKDSRDNGRTWSAARALPEGIIGPVKNKPLLLDDGLLLCGSSTEDGGWRVHMEWTADEGRTWSRTVPLNDGRTIEAIQPSLLLHPGGRIQALGRSRQGRLWTSWSADRGRTWSPLVLTGLLNPNSGTDAASLRDGRHILVYNPVSAGRTPLVAAISSDGLNWVTAAVLADGEGEFSYPAVIQAPDGLVHIVFTWQRRSVRHVVIDPERLTMPEKHP